MDNNKVKKLKRKRSNSFQMESKTKSVKFNLEINESFSDKNDSDEENSKIDVDTSLYRNQNAIKSNKDVTNDKLIKAIEQTNEELEKIFIDNQHLMDLRIVIPFEVPLAHKIERSVNELQSKQHLALFKGITINNKKYTKREDDLILKNFKEFCEANQIEHDPSPFLYFVINGKHLLSVYQRLQFVRYIGKGLNDRKLHSIYKRFQLLFSKVKKGRFSTMEDKILLTYINNNGDNKQKFSEVAKILNRSKEQILKRYLTITGSTENDFSKMSGIPKIEYLVSTIMEVLEVSTVHELKYTKITDKHWSKISKKMDDCPIHQIKRFWNLSVVTKLFNPNIKINKVLRTIINSLHEKKITDWKAIDWSEICKPYEKKYYTCAFIYDKFKDLKKCHVPKDLQQNPKACIRMLKNLFNECPCLLRKIQSYEYEDGRITKCQFN